MGGSTSTSRARNISLEVVSKKEKKHCRGPNSRGRTKRSSVNRPVLQLQVKPATLERVRQRLASTSGPHLITRKALHSLARDSGIYDTHITSSRTSSNASGNSDQTHLSCTNSTGSQDSVIMLEIVEDEDDVISKDMDDDDDDYDHLIPNIDFGHYMCNRISLVAGVEGGDGTFGRISLMTEVEEEEEEEGSDCMYSHISQVVGAKEEETNMDNGKRRRGVRDDPMTDITL